MLQEHDVLQQEEQEYQTFQGIPEDEIEEIHVYMWKKEPHQPFWHPWNMPKLDTILNTFMFVVSLVLLSGFVLLPGTLISHVQTITVPAHFSPVTYSAQAAIQATGTKAYPASKAYGYLTMYNASFLSQSLPSGFMVSSQSGIQVITDTSVFIPANNPPEDGVATVQAQAFIPGKQGNIQAGAIHVVYNASLYIRNLESFTGGHDAYTERYATNQDKQKAREMARRYIQAKQVAEKQPGLLAKPCSEMDNVFSSTVSVRIQCIYATYTYKLPANASLESARLQGDVVLLIIRTVVQPS